MRDTAEGGARGRAFGGVLLSLAAAATFGVFAPAAKAALTQVRPLRAAGLAYLVAGIVALLALAVRTLLSVPSSGRVVQLRDAPRLLGMTFIGGVLGPALFFSGIDLVSAHHAAIVQHLEFALTVLAAILVLGERPGRIGFVGLALIGAGLLLFSTLEDPSAQPATTWSWAGLLLLSGACLAWAADNTFARGASELDPLAVVSIKGLGAGGLMILLTSGKAELPTPHTWAPLLLAGGVGIGLSLVLELLALRRIGAALNAGLFATGPAFGFAWSILFLGEKAGATSRVALALCGLGAVTLAVDRHEHRHVHEEGGRRVEHSHPHVHDDRHRHRHDGLFR